MADLSLSRSKENIEEIIDNKFGETNNLLTENGYQILPGGLIMQWGTIPSVIGNNTYSDITYPIPFPTATLNAQVSGYTEGDDTADVAVQVTSFTASTLRTLLNTTGGTHKVMWFAIGY